MLPLELPPGTTIELLVTEAIPTLHARLVAEGGPDDAFTVAMRIDGRGSWTATIRGRQMRVEAGEERRPTLWMYTTESTAESFLRDALGPKHLLPKLALGRNQVGAGVLTLSDPRVIRRVSMANGRIELAAIHPDGERLAVVFGFGDATRRPIDPEDPDTVVEAPIDALQDLLRGERGPEETLSSGDVTVRGSRLLAMQLALAIAPFFPHSR
jgi:hypothetical protein